jgi:hypothetical protein
MGYDDEYDYRMIQRKHGILKTADGEVHCFPAGVSQLHRQILNDCLVTG